MLRSFLPYLARCAGVLLLATTSLACTRSQPADTTPVTNASADSLEEDPLYDFGEPAFRFELPDDLREISGLTVLNDEHLGAVEDENGVLYFLDMDTGEVIRDEKFHSDGDYEGIARAGDRVYVLQSDGDLFVIDDWRDDKFGSDKIETRLSRSCDAEGLTYDEAYNRLLIACKEKPDDGADGLKAIYAFDLATEEVAKQPVYTIDIAAFNKMVYPDDGALNEAVRGAIQPVLDLSGFKPSGLDIHPITGEVYVLSSVKQSVIVLSSAGAIQHIWELPKAILKQPEGIAFLPNGDMFISSEGGSGNGVMIRYTYQAAE